MYCWCIHATAFHPVVSPSGAWLDPKFYFHQSELQLQGLNLLTNNFYVHDKDTVFHICMLLMCELEFWEQSPKVLFTEKLRETSALQFSVVNNIFSLWTEKLLWLFQHSESEKRSPVIAFIYICGRLFVYFHISSYLNQYLFLQLAQRGDPMKTQHIFSGSNSLACRNPLGF